MCDGLLPSLTKGRLLELGAGTGLTSAVAAQLGASVVATELPEGVNLLRDNLEANARGCATVECLTWGTRVPDQQLQSFDMILGADITYVDAMLQPLLVTVLQFAASDASIVIAHSKVHNVTVDDVRALLEQFFIVEISVVQGEGAAPEVALLVARRRPGSEVAIAEFLQAWFDGGHGTCEYSWEHGARHQQQCRRRSKGHCCLDSSETARSD